MSPGDSSQQVINLIQAIASLAAQRAVLGEEVVHASIEALEKQLAELQGKAEPSGQQRKLITVLFMDVVGSSKIGERLDPEDVMEIMEGGLQRFAEIVNAEGGRVLRYMGDGFLAAFGVPLAHEDAPVHAVQAGLGIQSAARDYAQVLEAEREISGFQVRVGVNTGLVVVGGSTEADETVMGSAVNLGARLESAAPPGGVLISHDTYRHVRGHFDLEPMPPIQAKGFSELVPVYLVKGTRPRSFRSTNRGVEGVETRMVGRETELRYLQDALTLATEEGAGQMITVVGEAGVGKSRLFYEFQAWSEHLQHEVILYLARSRQEAQNQPYALLRDLFAFHFQIQDDDPMPVVREKFEHEFLKEVGDSFDGLASPTVSDLAVQEDLSLPGIARAHYLGHLLGFDFSGSPYIMGMRGDPQGLRDQALIFLEEYFWHVSERAPIIIVLEDVHWADDSSLDVANRLSVRTPEMPMLILCFSRPSLFELRLHWGEGQDNHTRLELRSLSKTESRLLVADILQKVERVPEELRELVIQGAEGNPFYIEELIKMLVEDGVILKEGGIRNSESFSLDDNVEDKRWQIQMERLESIKIPPTLTGVLQARLDSLSPQERKVLQEASVVGRTFWDRVVAHLHSSGIADAEEEIPANLSALRSKEMIFRREESAFAGTREYLFKHEILREVTYETVLKKVRRRYHGMIADWLISNGAEREREYAGLIGDHLQQAGRLEESVGFLIQAGLIAQQVYANEEAMRYYRRSLELLAELPQNPERKTVIIETFERLGDILELTGKHAAAYDAYQNALDRLPGNDPIQHARLLGRMANTRREESQYDLAEENYQAALTALADPYGENQVTYWPEWIRIQLDRIWMKYWMGRTLEIQELVENVGTIVEQYGLPEQKARYYTTLIQVDFRRDRYRLTEVTVSKARKALDAFQATGRLHEKTDAVFHLGFTLLWHGDLQEAERQIHASLRNSERTGDITLQARSLIYLAVIHRKNGNLGKVKEYNERSLNTSQRARIPVYIAMAKANQAWIAWQEEDLVQAEEFARAALDGWQQKLQRYPFHWAALWPLIAVTLTRKRVSEAVGYARRILDPSQQQLPEVLTAALEESVQAWDEGRSDESLASLRNAMKIAQETGWF